MSEYISEKNKITKKDFSKVFWRSFTLLGSFTYDRMEGIGFEYAIDHVLRKIWPDDKDYEDAMNRHVAAFNMTVAPSPFVMGLAIAMEEQAKEDEKFDKASINALKVSLMGPLSGIGDTFFWGIFRILACALAIPFAMQGNPIAPLILLVVFNIPNFLTRWYGLKIGYTKGSAFLTNLEQSGKMKLFTYCAGIVGMASVGCMIAGWVTAYCPLTFELSTGTIVIQEYIDQIMPKLIPLAGTMAVYALLKKNISVTKVILFLAIAGFVLGAFGIVG